MRLLRSILLVLFVASAAQAQQPAQGAIPPANPADVSSPDAIIAAVYDVISGPAGQARNWDRMRSLFAPGARLIPTTADSSGRSRAIVGSVDDYINRSGPVLERNGFFEREIARRTESFGRILHAFSTYESRRTASDPAPFTRGINSIQLLNAGDRWWIVTIYWDSERANNPIPERYLRSADR